MTRFLLVVVAALPSVVNTATCRNGKANMSVSNFSSMTTMERSGWVFTLDNQPCPASICSELIFKPQSWVETVQKTVPRSLLKTSFWGRGDHNWVLQLELTLHGRGNLTIDFGNAWPVSMVTHCDGKTSKQDCSRRHDVTARLNGVVFASALPGSTSKVATVAFRDGDKLEIREGMAVMVINAVHYQGCPEDTSTAFLSKTTITSTTMPTSTTTTTALSNSSSNTTGIAARAVGIALSGAVRARPFSYLPLALLVCCVAAKHYCLPDHMF